MSRILLVITAVALGAGGYTIGLYAGIDLGVDAMLELASDNVTICPFVPLDSA